MARFIEADVIQKIATEAEWLTQTRIPYKGQIMLVSDSSGKVVNMKVGDGVNPFADLNYMFDFTNSQRISAVAPGALPTPTEANRYMIVTEVGDYTYEGNTIVSITEDGYQATLWWTGSTWVSNSTVRVRGEDGYIINQEELYNQLDLSFLNENIATSWDGGVSTKKYYDINLVAQTVTAPTVAYFGIISIDVSNYVGKTLNVKICSSLSESVSCGWENASGDIISLFKNGDIGNPATYETNLVVPEEAKTLKLVNVFKTADGEPVNPNPYVKVWSATLGEVIQNLQENTRPVDTIFDATNNTNPATQKAISDFLGVKTSIELNISWDGGDVSKKYWDSNLSIVSTSAPTIAYFGAGVADVSEYVGKTLNYNICSHVPASSWCGFETAEGEIISTFKNGTIDNPSSWVGSIVVPSGAKFLKISNVFKTAAGAPVNPNPIIEVIGVSGESIQSQIDIISSKIPDNINKLILPDYIDSYVGAKIQLFKSAMMESLQSESFYIKVSSRNLQIGDDYPNMWMYTPTASGDIPLDFILYDINSNIIDSKTVTLRVKSVPATLTLPKVLFVGDSLTFYNRIPDEFYRFISTDTSSTTQADTLSPQTVFKPQGLGISGLSLLGTHRYNYLGWVGQQFNEGMSGYSALSFMTEAGSPFVFSGTYNFSQYVDNNDYSDLNAIFIGLGWNDINKYNVELFFKTYLTQLINGMRDALPYVKIFLWSENMPYKIGGVGNHPYGSDVRANLVEWRKNMGRAREIMLEISNEISNIVYIDSSIWVDEVTGSQFGNAPINNRTTTQVKRGVDDVHPSDSGFFQISDAIVQSYLYHN